MKKLSIVLLLCVCIMTVLACSKELSQDVEEGKISEEMLNHYLSRAVTHAGLASSHPEAPSDTFEDDLRMLVDIGAKFVGRAAYSWAIPDDEEEHFRLATERAALVHKQDPEMILQGVVFETAYEDVRNIPIPDWVFDEFDLEPEDRHFNYEAMIYEDGLHQDMWGPGASVPDMSRLETKMWFFYRAARYISAGFEALHFGQVHLMSAQDPQFDHWFDMLSRVRQYAVEHARRHFVLTDAHTHGVSRDGVLLFDFHSFPLRLKETLNSNQETILEMGYLDSIYGRSQGGVTPSGWETESLPYLVEVDNFNGLGEHPGEADHDSHWVWGYDEIAWFARQPEEYRNKWLEYAWEWVRQHDATGWLQMPTRRTLGGAPAKLDVDVQIEDHTMTVSDVDVYTYQANRASEEQPFGFNQEETIKRIWEDD